MYLPTICLFLFHTTVVQNTQSRFQRPKFRDKICSFILCWIQAKVSDPCGSGSATLYKSANFMIIENLREFYKKPWNIRNWNDWKLFNISSTFKIMYRPVPLPILTVHQPEYRRNCTVRYRYLLCNNTVKEFTLPHNFKNTGQPYTTHVCAVDKILKLISNRSETYR